MPLMRSNKEGAGSLSPTLSTLTGYSTVLVGSATFVNILFSLDSLEQEMCVRLIGDRCSGRSRKWETYGQQQQMEMFSLAGGLLEPILYLQLQTQLGAAMTLQISAEDASDLQRTRSHQPSNNHKRKPRKCTFCLE